MATYIYARVSTGGQTFEQQMQTVTEHFRKMKSDISSADGIVEEHVSGAVGWRQRKLRALVDRCNPGDTIFVSELSRLGRNQADIFSLVDYAVKKGVELFICKDNMPLENRTMGGKMFLFLYSMQAEAERTNTCERNLARAAWEREQIAKEGGFWSKSGKWINRQGRHPEIINGREVWDVSAMVEASARKRTDNAIIWRDESQAVKFAHRRRAEGWGIVQIAEELGKLFDENAPLYPDGGNPYGTPTGCKPTKGTVSKWCREMNPLAV